ncbi:putative fluoride ion transporter CrcB [Flavobacterium noncentrifugens]|uniref:Fluoride-specific ion channel FluC n=1 Tax=Flavobacterium noncentrifugens TaxID=1128970 RepID=A0A1G8YT24_9FLAO|nr:fluoride efflux transporter CrcB [Flavobacterium noncentrifugens]GEP51350.1 putative fluoride ion transporter CrcB [Flavobacterium noncentrifugens]SDK05941.1 CrcB protein [Flavobacterium noncentrifugens]
MVKTVLLVTLGGGIGSAFRYLTTVFVNKYYASAFPLATFIINILGCFLIGLLMGFFQKNNLPDSNLKWLLVTGFCGGYTTFSAFGFENISLLQSNNGVTAMLYICTSVITGLLAVWGGLILVR